jgi:hypothetical protein
LKVALVSIWLTAAFACSRHETPEGARAQTSGAATPATSPASPPAASVNLGTVPTPEDVEEDAAQRITEQNLESELDRLEREIQAE